VAQSGSIEIVNGASGRIAVRGALTFETACRAHEAGLRAIEAATAPEIEVECAQVDEIDSAGLAVMLDWLAVAREQNRSVRFIHVPDTLLAVARISEIEALLGSGS
jgi:phospholipid transport system transporter-binding protein